MLGSSLVALGLAAGARSRWVALAPLVAVVPHGGPAAECAVAAAAIAAAAARPAAALPVLAGWLARWSPEVPLAPLAAAVAIGWVPAAVEARYGVPRIDWLRVAAVTIPAHLGLAFATGAAWTTWGPAAVGTALVAAHGAGLFFALGAARWWGRDLPAAAAVLLVDHAVTLGAAWLLWGP